MDLVLKVLQRLTFWIGLGAMAAVLLFVGQRVYEQFTYLPAVGKVLGVTEKCDMSYRENRFSRPTRLVECAEVAAIKARDPRIDWHVYRSPFVSLVYMLDGKPVRATVRLAALARSSARLGDTIPILPAPGRPEEITGYLDLAFFRLWGALFLAGAVLFGLAEVLRRVRRRAQPMFSPLRSPARA